MSRAGDRGFKRSSGKYWPFLTAQAGEGVKNYARDYDLVS
jgi:hypothetical protein